MGERLSWLNALKKLARNSNFAPSPNAGSLPKPKALTRLRSQDEYFGPRNELRPTPGGLRVKSGGLPTTVVSKKAAPPPGKLLPVRNASSLVSSPAPPRYFLGRIGPKNFPLGWRSAGPIFGVHGNPECFVHMPLISQPPRILPTQSFRSRKIGRSQVPEKMKLCVASKSEGPRSVL